MMVTFISECEKKAHNRTRRVLDAFADRIGNNTWQTVITRDGLLAVKKLLGKTATKNTAVSCHWLRSRKRNQLIWVVGNKARFNAQGIVPVNYTKKLDALKTDDITVNIKTYYANTKRQPLDQHLFAVAYLSHQILHKLIGDETLAKTAYVAGYMHDMGKLDPAFQAWILDKTKKKLIEEIPTEGQHIDKPGKFSFEKHPRHNEISVLLYHLLNDPEYKKNNDKKRIRHAVFWHHTKPYRKEEFKELDTVYKKLKNNTKEQDLTTMFQAFGQMLNSVKTLSNEYFSGGDNGFEVEGFLKQYNKRLLDDLDEEGLPKYKRYTKNDKVPDYRKNLTENAKNNLVRSALISADRHISSLSNEALNSHIEEATLDQCVDEVLLIENGELKQEIQTCLDGFGEKYPDSARNQEQSKIAKQLTDVEHIGVLKGPAGCGKTKIALEWAAHGNAKKILWICPRVQVCQGLINDLTNSDYLPDSKIEINTGEFKYLHQQGEKRETPESEEFSGDIVVTTIDQIINSIVTHRNVTTLIQFMNSHVVFDEYHEYITMPAFNLLFAELIEGKKLQGTKANTLLVSATPNYYFVDKLLEIDEYDVLGIKSFNESMYNIQFTNFDEQSQGETNPLYKKQVPNTFVISNTAITAQKSFIKNQSDENAILMHSKFKKTDKQALFEKVFDSFKKVGNKQYDVLRSGPIVQASLNITCDRMITEFTNAENWLQRLGRLDRFGENSNPNVYITAVPQTIADNGKQTGSCARFLNRLCAFQSAKAWREFIQDKISEDPESVGINEIYDYYKEFYSHSKSLESIAQDLVDALKQSVDVIAAKVHDPIFIPRKKKIKDDKVKIKKQSLRGDNRFVQMAVCQINEKGVPQFLNEYAYDETLENDGSLTVGVEQIMGYGDSQKDLLAFMVKKHHNIKDGKKSYKDSFTLNEARDPEAPIYLSYTIEDLEKIHATPHPNAIYYAKGINQVIGALSITNLNTAEEL